MVQKHLEDKALSRGAVSVWVIYCSYSSETKFQQFDAKLHGESTILHLLQIFIKIYPNPQSAYYDMI